MKRARWWSGLVGSVMCLIGLSACFHPPYNNFRYVSPWANPTMFGNNAVSFLGSAAGSVLDSVGMGPGSEGYLAALVRDLRRWNIEVILYRETMTVVIPTDQYFIFNSPHLQDIQYRGLSAMMHLIHLYPHTKFYVAGFTDRVGLIEQNMKLAEARAHTMVAFLYANGVPARQLKAQTFGPYFPEGDHHLIHGSAYNRRIEIQWKISKICPPCRAGENEAVCLEP